MSVTHMSRRDSRCDIAVSHALVTPLVTVPPTRPDPTHNYYRAELSIHDLRWLGIDRPASARVMDGQR